MKGHISMKEIYEKMKADLKPRGGIENTVADYIAWQLDTMRDQTLAEQTAKELTDGTFSLRDAVDAVRKAGDGRTTSDEDGYRAIRAYLKIDGVITEAEAALWFLRNIPRETMLEVLGMIKNEDPIINTALDLGLDDLFGEG